MNDKKSIGLLKRIIKKLTLMLIMFMIATTYPFTTITKMTNYNYILRQLKKSHYSIWDGYRTEEERGHAEWTCVNNH